MSDSPEQIQQEIDRSRQDAAQKIDQISTHLQGATGEARETIKHDVPEMIREGVDVAKDELKEDATKVGVGSAEIAGAGVLAGVGGLFLLQMAMELLARRLPRWQAAGMMGLGLAGAAAALGMSGKEQLKPDELKPERTMSVVQQTKAWVKSQASALRSRTAKSESSVREPEVQESGM